MSKTFLNSGHLKLIAIISMFVDHLYKAGLISDSVLYIAIGRMAMPIFAFCVAEGMFYTKSKGRYMARMFLFAVLSELPFDLMNFGRFSMEGQNILWTFLITMYCAYGSEAINKRIKGGSQASLVYLYIMYSTCGAVLSFAFAADYMPFLVYGVTLMYMAKKLELTGLNYLIVISFCIVFINGCFAFVAPEQMWGCLALIPISLYNGEPGKSKVIGRLLYVVYPLHMLAVYVMTLLFK